MQNFGSNLCELIKALSEHFCSTLQLARNYIRVFYKFEMNFQIRSFGLKDAADVEALSQYLDNLYDLTMYLIKTGDQSLRDATVHLLAGWNRVIMEIKNQDLK